MKLQDLILKLNEIFIVNYSLDFDNSGSQVLDISKNDNINTIGLTLDISLDVIEWCKNNNIQLLISHHPLIFRPLKSISSDNFQGKIIYELIKNNINLYSAHTNFDRIEYSFIAEILNAKVIEPISDIISFKYLKANIFFKNTNKFFDIISELEKNSYKVNHYQDNIISLTILENQINLLEKIIYEIINKDDIYIEYYDLHGKEKPFFGIGSILELNKEYEFDEFLEYLLEKFSVDYLEYSFKKDKIKKIAFCGGSGSSIFNKIIKKNVDCFITSDVGHHVGLDSIFYKIPIINLSHYDTEKFLINIMHKKIENITNKENVIIKIYNNNSKPFKLYKKGV